MKKLTIFLMFLLCSPLLKAQDVYDKYIDFNKAIAMDNDKDKALSLANEILTGTEKLPAKTQTNFYAKVAKLYEDKNEQTKAITFWEKVLAAEPNYYVAHRALGYLYIQQSNALAAKINASRKDPQAYATYTSQYQKIIKSSLFHLEKAQACDPDDTSLNYIKKLYQQLNDSADLNSLSARLTDMSKHCVELLTD
ncbi:tetratricopeptide repeat protein [Mucilaginibacter gracilis]|nr:hypothetical protein [Mucilaginibacter gracilis]